MFLLSKRKHGEREILSFDKNSYEAMETLERVVYRYLIENEGYPADGKAHYAWRYRLRVSYVRDARHFGVYFDYKDKVAHNIYFYVDEVEPSDWRNPIELPFINEEEVMDAIQGENY